LGWNLHGTHAQNGELVQLVGLRHKSFIFRLQSGTDFQSHRGVIHHDDIIGKPWGTQIVSHNGSPFFMLQPALADLLRNIKRSTQILYPKDIGFILVTMGIGPGQHVLEAGTGSGAFTSALAFNVGPQGHVTTYEARPEFQELAKKNVALLGLDDRVTFKLGNIGEGFEETGMDALFLDVANPWDYIPQVRSALKPGGYFGSILPTTNQVTQLLAALTENQFAFMDVCEVMLRYYRAEATRFRPTDRMIAHTGYLIFGRPVIIGDSGESLKLLEEAAVLPVEEDSRGDGF
jgi:tRNA (adenine57-N1/adenine58-N1)-methyltransferase catalytic subunit